MKTNLIDIFNNYYPMLKDFVSCWRPHGTNAIVVWLDTGCAFIFSKDDNRYVLEPYLF